MREFVTLSVTSFRGAGGEHYYGRLEVATKEERRVNADGSESWITRAGYGVVVHPHDRTELRRTITAKEAVYLNRKDQDGIIFRPSTSLKRGDLVPRFNDKASLEAAAIAAFGELFDDTDVLAIEDVQYSDEHRPLAGPAEIVEGMKADPDYAAQRRFLVEHGYLRRPGEPEESENA